MNNIHIEIPGRQALADLPVEVRIIKTGQDKADFIAKHTSQGANESRFIA